MLNATQTRTSYTRASYMLSAGIVVFLLQALRPAQIQWAILEISSAALFACINYYLHHYVQRHAHHSLYLQAELYACSFLSLLLAPIAWLEFNTIHLTDVNVSFAAVTLVAMCALYLGYRRLGLFFNSLSQPETAKYFIATTFLAVIITSHVNIPLLLIAAMILLAVCAYLSSVDPSEGGGSNLSRAKINILLALCALLLLVQCSVAVLANSVTATPVSISSVPSTPNDTTFKLDPEFEFKRLICLRKVRERVLHEVGSNIKDGEPLAYMDFPMHSNLGDVLIWQGTQLVLENRAQFPIVTDHFMDRNITRANEVRSETIFVSDLKVNFFSGSEVE